jgi:hypothetical protein
MALISKKTFRKWARPLTERGLTLENVELMSEMGNGITFKPRQKIETGYAVVGSRVVFNVGVVWLDGSIVPIQGDKKPGDIISLPFDVIGRKPQVIYCELHYSCVSSPNIYTFEGYPENFEVNFFTANKVVVGAGTSGVANIPDYAIFGVATKKIFQEGEVIDGVVESFSQLNSLFDASTGDTVPGFIRKIVGTITWIDADPPTVPIGFWSAQPLTAQFDPKEELNASRMIVFNSTMLATEQNALNNFPSSLSLY